MIVARELLSGGLMLREVETEAEAFAEMRRFNEVNHIYSNVTEVRWIEEKVNNQHIKEPRHKRVEMGTWFGIYYDEKPPHLELKDEAFWGITREGLDAFNPAYHFNPHIRKRVCWYDEVKAYFEDLAVRKAGGG